MSTELQYGAVLSSGAVPEVLPGNLKFAVISGDMLEHAAPVARVPLYLRDIVAPELAALLPEQNATLKAEFVRFFRGRCKKALALRIREIGIRFDWERAFRDEAYAKSLLLLLRGTFGILEEYRLTLRLALRLPGTVTQYRTLLRDLLYPRLGLAVECTPDVAENDLAPIHFYSDSFTLLPGEGDRNWTREEVTRLLAGARELAGPVRRIGIVTDHIETAAELAALYADTAAGTAPVEQGELSLC